MILSNFMKDLYLSFLNLYRHITDHVPPARGAWRKKTCFSIVIVKAHVDVFLFVLFCCFSQPSKRTEWRNFSDICLTEEIQSDQWTYTLHTVASKSCVGWNDSTSVNITIDSQKPRGKNQKAEITRIEKLTQALYLDCPHFLHPFIHNDASESDLHLCYPFVQMTPLFFSYTAQVVTKFKCVLDRRGTKCSWTPVNQSFKPTVAYR